MGSQYSGQLFGILQDMHNRAVECAEAATGMVDYYSSDVFGNEYDYGKNDQNYVLHYNRALREAAKFYEPLINEMNKENDAELKQIENRIAVLEKSQQDAKKMQQKDNQKQIGYA